MCVEERALQSLEADDDGCGDSGVRTHFDLASYSSGFPRRKRREERFSWCKGKSRETLEGC